MFGLQSSEKTGHETQYESQQQQQYPSKMEHESQQQQQSGRSKQQSETMTHVANRQQTKPGRPQIGVIIAGFPSSLAKELTKECVKEGLFVSNIGLCCRQSGSSRGTSSKEQQHSARETTEKEGSTSTTEYRGEQESIQGISKMELVDCDSQDARDFLERARDALEKEGAEVVIVLDVSNDCRSIETYNRLKLPFVHSGSETYSEELKMKEETTASRNACVLSPFVSLEAGKIQLLIEGFSRIHPGTFRGWTLDCDDHMSSGSTLGAAKRRTMNALSYLIDQDHSNFSKWSSGKGTLFHSDESQQKQQQPQREQPQQHEQQHESGGLMAKLGLGSAVSSTKETVKEATQSVQSATTMTTMGCRSSFTLRSPDGKQSISIAHEQYDLADTCGILQMAEFLADKIDKQREPRVWGLKDWVPGVDDLNRQIAECCESMTAEEQGIETETQVYLKGGRQRRQHQAKRVGGQQQEKYERRERREPTGHSLQQAQQQNVNDPTRNYPTSETGMGQSGHTVMASDVTSATTVETEGGQGLRAKGTTHQ